MAKKSDLMKWMDARLAADPELARAVDERLAEMRVEQELVALREKKGLSQKELAVRIGATQPYVAKLESGKVQNLGLKTLVKYATALGSQLTVRFEPMRHHRKPAGAGAATMSTRRLVRRTGPHLS